MDFSCWDRLVKGIVFRFRSTGVPADELLQVARIALWRGIPKWDRARSPMEAWVYRIVKTAICDYLRDQKRHTVRGLIEYRWEAPDVECSTSAADSLVRVTDLLSALEGLPAEDFQMLIGRAEGRSFEELGRAEGVSDGAARVRVHRIRSKAAELLREAGIA